MAGGIDASVTLHVEVFDPQAMWDHAFGAYARPQLRYKVYDSADPTRLGHELHREFMELCGPRDKPDIGECLRMIFDPGESPPGVQIEDSAAEIAPQSSEDQYLLFVTNGDEHGADRFGARHD
ncbi:hypothetical protein DFR49_0721 [Hephaestia caeni]|uniref:Uncharacterized protein n=1 Tax=Hephaestia caeni TaxID=645617 RepID=A0A397PB55_9SPHN|nr:hypothetical protein [Hephaestia caeni]RIA46188.1 hypothetical protein DFR49_0721 [Hephaestia caeni]